MVKGFFEEKSTKLTIFGLCAKSFRVFARIFDRVAETALYALKKPYEDKLLALKNFQFKNFFRTISENLSSALSLLCFSKRKISYQTFLLKTKCRCRIPAELFSIFGGNFLSRLSKLYSRKRDVHFSWKFLLLKQLVFFQACKWTIFRNFAELFSTGLQTLRSTCPR